MPTKNCANPGRSFPQPRPTQSWTAISPSYRSASGQFRSPYPPIRQPSLSRSICFGCWRMRPSEISRMALVSTSQCLLLQVQVPLSLHLFDLVGYFRIFLNSCTKPLSTKQMVGGNRVGTQSRPPTRGTTIGPKGASTDQENGQNPSAGPQYPSRSSNKRQNGSSLPFGRLLWLGWGSPPFGFWPLQSSDPPFEGGGVFIFHPFGDFTHHRGVP